MKSTVASPLDGWRCRLRRARAKRLRAFTLVEILIVIAIIGVLAALGFSVFGRGRSTARRAQCDVNLKALAIALDAFRQEHGRYPQHLKALWDEKLINDPALMRCPDDPDLQSVGYDLGYVQRSVRNSDAYGNELPPLNELPTIVCPFHEKQNHGVQAFAGMYTHQFATRPATLVSANAASVLRAGTTVAIPGSSGMELHGGDRIQTTSAGAALIRFADGTTANVAGVGDVTVLQSFLMGGQSTLYSLLRQTLGDVTYTVNHGSKFDVTTPTATAGALGTEFRIVIQGRNADTNSGVVTYSEQWINISQSPSSEVYCSYPSEVVMLPHKIWVDVPLNDKDKKKKKKDREDSNT